MLFSDWGGVNAQETLFDYTVSEGDTRSTVKATVGIVEFGADKVEQHKDLGFYAFKADGDLGKSAYVKGTLVSNTTFETGDIITITMACTSNPSGSDYGISIYLGNDTEATLVGTLYCTQKNTAETFSYIVKESDAIVGKSDFYLFRASGKSTYIYAAKVTRSTENEELGEYASLINYPKATTGIELMSSDADKVTYSTVDINSNSTDCIKFDKSYKNSDAEYYYAALTVEGGFKKGDVVTIAGVYSNDDATKTAKIELYSDTNGKLWTTNDLLNTKKEEGNPQPQCFTLNNDTETLYIGRNGGTSANVTLLKVERNVAIVNVTNVGYCTYASEYALDFTDVEGLTAYTANVSDDEVSFTPVEGIVPAKTGLLIEAKGGEYTIPVASGDAGDAESALVGVTTEGQTATTGDFVLMNQEGVAGFYRITADEFVLTKNTAYLPANGNALKTSNISYIALPGVGGDGTTSLKAIENKVTEDGKLYDLQGRQVTYPAKGLYIKNGKKYIVK